MAKQDYYETLGVARGGAAGRLKKAYRKLAMQFHPDRNPGDKKAEQKFKDINEAYDVLKDDEKRAAYDRYGHAAFEHGSARGFDAGGFGNFASVFDDIFAELMGGGPRRGGRMRGADLPYNLEITLEEAFTGKPTTITVQGAVSCEA